MIGKKQVKKILKILIFTRSYVRKRDENNRLCHVAQKTEVIKDLEISRFFAFSGEPHTYPEVA